MTRRRCWGARTNLACNYNPEANVEDGTCEFESCQWCDDPEACNYEGEGLPWTANTELCDFIPDGECDCDGNVLDAAGVCGGDCTVDEDGDGVCDDVDTCVGVLDACGVCNGPGAVYECGCDEVPEGDCDCNGNQVDAVGVCGGNCALDSDGDGWCDECINSPVEGYTLQTEVVVEHLESCLMGMTTYRVYMACANALDYVNTCSGDNTNPLVLNSASGSWFNHPANVSFNAAGMNLSFEMFPNLEFDSYITIGSETTGGDHPSAIWGAISASDEFDGGVRFQRHGGRQRGRRVVLAVPGLGRGRQPSWFCGRGGACACHANDHPRSDFWPNPTSDLPKWGPRPRNPRSLLLRLGVQRDGLRQP